MTSGPPSPSPSHAGDGSWGPSDPYGYGHEQPDPLAAPPADADRGGAPDPYGAPPADPYGAPAPDPYAAPSADHHGATTADPYASPYDPYGPSEHGAGAEGTVDTYATSAYGTRYAVPAGAPADPYGGAVQKPYAPQGYASGYVPAPPTSGLALAGMILGIVGLATCSGIPSVIGIILSAVSLRETGSGERSGRGFAIAGIVTSGIGLLVILAVVVFYIVVFVVVGTQST